MYQTGFGAQGQLCTPQMMGGGQLCTPGQEVIAIPVSAVAQFIPYISGLLGSLGGMMMPPMAGGAPMGGGPDVYAIDKPVEKPNIMQMEEPHVGKPTLPPDAALRKVLSLIITEPFADDDNLFEKGLDSFKVMQIITRSGENGYRVKMPDIFRNPTFNGIVEHMVAGE